MVILLVDTVKRVCQKTSDLKYLLFELLTETVTMLWFRCLSNGDGDMATNQLYDWLNDEKSSCFERGRHLSAIHCCPPELNRNYLIFGFNIESTINLPFSSVMRRHFIQWQKSITQKFRFISHDLFRSVYGKTDLNLDPAKYCPVRSGRWAQRFGLAPNQVSCTWDCRYFQRMRIDNSINWWTAFHCRSRPLGYGLLLVVVIVNGVWDGRIPSPWK